jgi:small subunit ribosomal protein S2
LFVVDISKEYIAVREATRLNIPVFAMVDTNSDPNLVDFPIPANDDASKSISLIVNTVCEAIEEGLSERKMEREKETASKEHEAEEHEDDDDTTEHEEGDEVLEKIQELASERKSSKVAVKKHTIVDDED